MESRRKRCPFVNDFNVSHSGCSALQSAKPDRFSSSEPASFTGVVAGTEGCFTRRWNCGGGRVARLGDFLDYPAGKTLGDDVVGQVVFDAGNGVGGASKYDQLHDESETERLERFPGRRS